MQKKNDTHFLTQFTVKSRDKHLFLHQCENSRGIDLIFKTALATDFPITDFCVLFALRIHWNDECYY